MFRKLRIQFIAVVMVSVALVLGIVFTSICINEYKKSADEVDRALSSAIDHASGGFTGQNSNASAWGDNRPPRNPASGFVDGEEQLAGPQIGGRGDERNSIVPVAVYVVTEDESYSAVSAFTTAQIDSDVLSEASDRIREIGDGSGTLNDLGLIYMKRTSVQTTYVAFADTSSTESWKSIAVSLAIAALGILVAFFFIAYFLSNWALKPVKEAWESQRQFVADASHELKTPLTVILANNSILMKHSQDTIASQSQWIESTQAEAVNMQGLVNEMLELAQVESRAAVHHEELDFSDLVDGVTLQFESIAFERGCHFAADIAEQLIVDGDESRLRKAISTLIENALKYVDEEGTVSVSLEKSGRNAMLKINNTGSVIDTEDLPHIFDRFYRTDKARTSGAGGYGLGLAIAREIAREHDGDIICTSSANEGTTFTMSLPLK